MDATGEEYKYSGALRVGLARSRIAQVFVLLSVVATLSIVAVTPLHASVRVLMATWVMCGALHALARIRKIARVAVSRSGAMAVEVAGVWREGRVRDRSFVAPFLAVVRWRPDGARFDRCIAILPDMLPREDFRSLRVLLRWR